MSALVIFRLLWNVILVLGGAFLLYFLVTYPFQRRWLTARIRTEEWLKGRYFRGGQVSPVEFEKVGAAVEQLAGSLEKLISNYRNTGKSRAMKGLRNQAKEIVISITESVTVVLEHWKSLAGMDLVGSELEARALRDSRNLETLHQNLEAFRASFQRAAVSQTSEALTEATERISEVSHFTRLMSESIESGQILESD